MSGRKREGTFSWGAVAPRSLNVQAFQANLKTATSWLEPFEGFGPLSSNAEIPIGRVLRPSRTDRPALAMRRAPAT